MFFVEPQDRFIRLFINVKCIADLKAIYSTGRWEKDWVNIASEWGPALSLDNGLMDGKSSNARLLTQLIPTSSTLNASLPSISEALAVLVGNTLLLSALDSPFVHYFNYSDTTLPEPQYQSFRATLRAQKYASGGTQNWQGIFYVVLVLVFAINLFCSIYFVIKRNRVTDFIEPQNLFCLSLNSPPSAVLDGTCGGGPEKEHFNANWHIKLDRERDHLYVENSDLKRYSHRRNFSQETDYEMEGSQMARMYSKLSRKRTSRL